MKRKNQHFRKTPDYIIQSLQRINSQHIVVASIFSVNKSDLANGALEQIGITSSEQLPKTLTPDMLSGLYARRNRNGFYHIRKDLPKTYKTYCWSAPNFGDSSKGYHDVFYTREVYQRDFEAPRDWDINLSILKENNLSICIKATISTVLNRDHSGFHNDLFFASNLLQEQFGHCCVLDAQLSDEEFVKQSIVEWEIFPPGTLPQQLSKIFSHRQNIPEDRQKEIKERFEVIKKLNPSEFIRGIGLNARYFGAKFGENIVAFENIEYGNAIYILFDNWEEISKMSRIDILKRHERDFIRIPHRKGWEKTLELHIKRLRMDNNQGTNPPSNN